MIIEEIIAALPWARLRHWMLDVGCWMLGVLPFLLGAPSAGATTVTLTPIADTEINSYPAYSGNNFGLSNLGVGGAARGNVARTLMRFDLSSLPAGATITGVELTMNVVKLPPGDMTAGPVSSDYDLYPMLVSWVEGTGSGTAGSNAQPGETTWNERGAGGFASWGAPGGQIGTDFTNNWDASAAVGLNLGPVVWGSTPEFVADAQSWLDNPANNFGFILLSDGENNPGTIRRLASRESTTPPTLTVDYTATPEPGTGMLLLGGLVCCMARRRVLSVKF